MRLGTYLLKRSVVGQGLGSAPTSERVAARRAVGVEPIEVAPHEVVSMGRAEDRARAPRRRVEVGPNAPLLIRLVRHPYSQAVTRPRRRQVGDRGLREQPGRERLAAPVPGCRDLRDRDPSGPERRHRASAPPRPTRKDIMGWMGDGYPGDPE